MSFESNPRLEGQRLSEIAALAHVIKIVQNSAPMAEIATKFVPKTVQDIVNCHANGHLNLSPGFQRDSVWNERDRQKLIESILRKYPIPAVFFRRRQEDGEIHFDVIDGRQRIESVLMFMGKIRGRRFRAKVQLPGDDEQVWLDWRWLCRKQKQHLVTGYEIPTIEVDGDLADVIDLFVRINSTGKALTSAEKRHAKYHNSVFLREAGRLAARYQDYFRGHRILSASQIDRKKHVELICEIMVSLHQGDIINKKAALDSVMKPGSLTQSQVRRVRAKTILALNRVRHMFPDIHRTRFSKISDYYSLIVLIAKFENDRLILTDRRRNKLAWELLTAFGAGVDDVRLRQKRAEGSKPGQELYREYLLTVLEGTDEISHRRKREEILRNLLQSLFERRDENRLFNEEQRRILWNTTDNRKCRGCGKPLTWSEFTIDHIDPFSKGGRTRLENAALMCRRCNSRKGNRRD
jgi:hypothetical protein